MTLSEFENCSAEEQLSLVERNGVLVGRRAHTHHNIELFQLDAFYVEVFFRKKDSSVWKICGFDHPVLLQPYLDQNNLSNLL